MRLQAEEERDHADRLLDFILDRGGNAVIGDVEAPRGDFSGPEEVFDTALSQEEAVTAAIHDLYRLADKLGDLASIPFLLDFISEQTEEEAMLSAIVDRLALADGQSGALFILDHELGGREGDPGA
jgi:ferritin